MDEDVYPALEAAGKAAAYREDLGLKPSAVLVNAAAPAGRLRYPDIHAYETARLEVLRTAFPENSRYRTRYARDTLGWYISESRLFPLGDNRDNSRDGRYFGPVRKSKILGQGSIIYWPPGRMGPIR
jgi:signal peptidase I